MATYAQLMDDLYDSNDECETQFAVETSSYDFVDAIPKESLYVKLNPDITDAQRTFVSNGIRNFFQGQTTVMLVKHDVVDSFSAVTAIFNLFTAIIAAISLFIAFFLLLISMTQNVNEASWEFGVLRSMGLTQAEGLRIYMYEAYVVVITAAILGVTVGFITATAVAI